MDSERDATCTSQAGGRKVRSRSTPRIEWVEKADAHGDLDELVALHGLGATPSVCDVVRATFDEIIDEWFAAGCPNVLPTTASRQPE